MKIVVVLVVVLFVVASIFYLFKRLSKGIKRDLTELRLPLYDLLSRGYNHGVLIYEHVGSEKFVQFRKYLKENGDSGIIFGFPCVEWSKEYFRAIKEYCVTNDIGFDEFAGPPAILEIDFGQDVEGAYRFVCVVTSDIFKHDEEQSYFVLLEGASVS